MKSKNKIEIDKKTEKRIVSILKKNKITKAGIFGSYARGEAKKNSDIDILVKFNGSLLELVGIEIELKNILKKKVDLITYKAINPLLKKIILSEEVRII